VPCPCACATYNAHVAVDRSYPLVRAWLEQLARDELFEREHHTVFALYADRCAAVLNCLDGIFDLAV
jgi:hypothetical protein